MADIYKAPLLTYAAIATGGNLTNFKTAANAAITVLINALAPSSPAGVSMPHTDFDRIPPVTAAKICAELVAIQAVITAGT